MANENRIQIVLTTDASGAVIGIDKVNNAQKQLADPGLFASIKNNWIVLSAMIASAVITISKGIEAASLGAKIIQIEEAFHNLSKTADADMKSLEQAMRHSVNYTIDSSDLMQKAIKGMTQGLSGEDMVKIGEMARVTARTQGIEVKEAFDKIADSIANEIPRAMRTMGLLTKEQMGLINRAISAGVEDVNMLELAYKNAQIKTLELGAANTTLAEKMAQSRANVQELREDLQKITARTWEIAITTTADWYKSAKNTLAAFTKGETWRIMEPEMLYEAPPSTEEEIRLYEKLLVLQRENLENDIKGRTEGAKNTDKVKAAAEAYADWAIQVGNLNPGLSEQAKLLAENNRQAEKLIAKGVAKNQVEETRALAEYYLKQKEVIEAEKDLADWQKDMYRMAEEELAYFTAMQGTELDKQIAQIDSAAAKIGANLGKLGLDAEEFETRWAEIARVSEIVKQTARDESHNKLIQQLKEQGNQYQALFDQQRQYQISNYNDIWSGLSATAGQSGDYATGANMILSSMRGITDVMTGQDKYTQEYERAREHYNQMRELYQQNVNDYGGSEAAAWELSEAYQQMIIARDQQTASMRLQTTQSMFGTMAGLAQAFYTAGGKQSQAAFNLYKAFAIAEATIAGYKATMNAYEFGTKFGGPVVGAIMAATAAATAAMYIASIASQTMSSIATPTVTSSGGTSSISTTATRTATTEQKAETRPLVVNFYNYGFISEGAKDELARELVPALQKAVNDGAH